MSANGWTVFLVYAVGTARSSIATVEFDRRRPIGRCDRDVATMVARFSGAGLGLMAFTITTAMGLFAHNPVEVTLSRSIFALFLFCIVGAVLGGVAQRIIAEHQRERQAEISNRYRSDSVAMDGDVHTDEEFGGAEESVSV